MLNKNDEMLTLLMSDGGEFYGDEDKLEENVDPEFGEATDYPEDDESYMFN